MHLTRPSQDPELVHVRVSYMPGQNTSGQCHVRTWKSSDSPSSHSILWRSLSVSELSVCSPILNSAPRYSSSSGSCTLWERQIKVESYLRLCKAGHSWTNTATWRDRNNLIRSVVIKGSQACGRLR